MELTQAVDEFTRCIEGRDQAAAERILDDDYALVLVHPAPAIVSRAQWLAMLPDYVVHRYEVQERIVDMHPDGTTAAVLHRAQMDATVLGEDRSGLFVVSDLWRRDASAGAGGGADGRDWRLWRRHSTPLSAGRMPGASG